MNNVKVKRPARVFVSNALSQPTATPRPNKTWESQSGDTSASILARTVRPEQETPDHIHRV